MNSVKEYAERIFEEIQSRKETLEYIKTHMDNFTQLDPNYRLESGYTNALARVYKDLCLIAGERVPDDFYPDLSGFLDNID